MFRKKWGSVAVGLTLALVVGLLLVLGGCGGKGNQGSPAPQAAEKKTEQKQADSTKAAESKKQKVGFSFISYSAFQWPDYIAEAKGFFAGEGLEVTEYNVKNNPEIVQLMVSGDAPITTGNSTDGMLMAIGKGAKIKGIMSKAASSPYDVVVSSKIKSFADMKGKKIAVSQVQSASTIMLYELAKKEGLQPSDFQALEVGGTNERYAALKNGGVEGAVLNPPSNFKAMDEGFKVLGTFTDSVPDYDFTSVAVDGKFAQEHPDVVQKFTNALVKALDWLSKPANKNEAIDVLAKKLKLDQATAAKSYDYFIGKAKAFTPDGAPRPVAYQKMLDITMQLKLINKPITINEYYDTSFQQKAVTALKK